MSDNTIFIRGLGIRDPCGVIVKKGGAAFSPARPHKLIIHEGYDHQIQEVVFRVTKTLKVLFDGAVFRPTGPVDLEAGKKYTITVKLSPEDPDVDKDPAFDIASLAVDTHIPDLAAEHDHYLYGTPKRDTHER